MKSEAIAALAAKVGVEVSCRGGERAAVRHHPRHPLEARPRTIVLPLFECASQVEAMVLERLASVAPVVQVRVM